MGPFENRVNNIGWGKSNFSFFHIFFSVLLEICDFKVSMGKTEITFHPNQYLKNLKTVKNSVKNMDHRQIFICNNHRCI